MERVVVDGQTSLRLDLATLRPLLQDTIDREAGDFRKRFITDIPGQAQTYQNKEDEARLWSPGDDVAHPERYPFMIAEASLRGLEVAQVRAEIIAQVSALKPLAALVEAHRINAKQAVASSVNAPQAVRSASVDWSSLVPNGSD